METDGNSKAEKIGSNLIHETATSAILQACISTIVLGWEFSLFKNELELQTRQKFHWHYI